MQSNSLRRYLLTLLIVVSCGAALVGIGRATGDYSHRRVVTRTVRVYGTRTITLTVTQSRVVVKRVPYEPAACLRLNTDLAAAYSAVNRFESDYGGIGDDLVRVQTDFLSKNINDLNKLQNKLFTRDSAASTDVIDLINTLNRAKTDKPLCLEATK